MSADPEILAEVPLFQLLDADERAALAAKVEAISAPAGKILFNYGDPGDSLYIVREGQVEIFFKNDTGQRIVLERSGAGDFFGELSLIDAGPRTASALVTQGSAGGHGRSRGHRGAAQATSGGGHGSPHRDGQAAP